MAFDKLTRNHGIKIEHSAGAEECSLAVGAVVGYQHVKSASRMNGATVIFLDSVEKARVAIENGVILRDTLCPVLPLSSPSRKIIISNVPPFIKDELILKELERYGRVVSSIRKISLGCKSPLLKHLVSFRRQVYMVLHDSGEDLNITMKFKVENFDYVVFATSDSEMKCFKCGIPGHTVRNCARAFRADDKTSAAGPSEPNATNDKTGAAADPSEPSSTNAPVQAAVDVNVTEPVNVPDGSAMQSETVKAGSAVIVENENASSTEPKVDMLVNDMINKELAALRDSATGVSDSVPDEGVEAHRGASGSQDVEMAETFKLPSKRKNIDNAGTKAKKADMTADDSDADSDDSNWSGASQVELNAVSDKTPVRYKADDISRFLRETKGQQGVEVELYFPDRQQFVNDVCTFRSEGLFTKKEVSRLNKMLTELRRRIRCGEQSHKST